MSQSYTFGKDIVDDVLDRAAIDNDNLSDKTERFVNRAYFDLLQEAPWPFALKYPPGVIDVLDDVTDTITATLASSSATITTASTTTNMTGRKLIHDSNQVPYYIVLHSGTTLTLDATWKEASCTTEACTIYQDVYALATDCARPWSFKSRSTGMVLNYSDAIDVHALSGTDIYGSEIVTVTQVSNKTVKLKPWIKEPTTIEYIYCQEQDALDFTGSGVGDTPVIPPFDRHIIADMAYVMTLHDWLDKSPSLSVKIESTMIGIQRKLSKMKAFYKLLPSSFSA